MSPRKPNMLEAFQASAKAEKARQAAAEAAEGSTAYAAAAPGATGAGAEDSDDSVGVGGPFAGTTKPVTAQPAVRPDVHIHPKDLMSGSPEPSDSSLRRALSGGGKGVKLSQLQLPVLVLGVLVAMLAMFFLGRWFSSPNETQASGPGIGEMAYSGDPDGALAAVRTYQDPTLDESNLTAADRAFLDRKSRLSVRAIEFPATERGNKLANITYEYLLASGLPAVAPITQGEIQFICVGAAPTLNAEIEAIQAALQAMPGPPPGNQVGAFSSAYFVNIEAQIDDEYRLGTP